MDASAFDSELNWGHDPWVPRAAVNKIEIFYEVSGDQNLPAVLLINGLGGQLINWDRGFCDQLLRRGVRVVRFDNRDAGLSTILDDAPGEGLPLERRLELGAPYGLEDMADDAAALLDELHIARAHVVGLSMGGMIAQLLAIGHSSKVASLCSIMSTTGEPGVGSPTARALEILLRPAGTTRSEVIDGSLESAKVIASPGFPFDEEYARNRAQAEFDRAYHPQGTQRQLLAILSAKDRTVPLGEIKVPTVVIHGGSDPLIAPSGGEATARAVPRARLEIIEGMGHDLPPQLWSRIAQLIVDNAAIADPRLAPRGPHGEMSSGAGGAVALSGQ